jgi:hypothetical protein
MAISYYAAFEVKIDNDDGTVTMCPAQVVKVYDVAAAVALADLVSDAAGVVAAGTFAVDPDTLIRFAFNRPDLICGYSEIYTTASAGEARTKPPRAATILDQARDLGVLKP